MSLIKPRTRGKQFVSFRTRMEQENNETVHAYAAFLGESVEYVVNQLIDTVLAKDREFVAWRAEHSGSHVTRRQWPKKKRSSSSSASGTSSLTELRPASAGKPRE